MIKRLNRVPFLSVIKQLIPLLDKDDIVINGGNSFFQTTGLAARKLLLRGAGPEWRGSGGLTRLRHSPQRSGSCTQSQSVTKRTIHNERRTVNPHRHGHSGAHTPRHTLADRQWPSAQPESSCAARAGQYRTWTRPGGARVRLFGCGCWRAWLFRTWAGGHLRCGRLPQLSGSDVDHISLLQMKPLVIAIATAAIRARVKPVAARKLLLRGAGPEWRGSGGLPAHPHGQAVVFDSEGTLIKNCPNPVTARLRRPIHLHEASFSALFRARL